MKKKTISLILILSMVMTMLVGCGSKDDIATNVTKTNDTNEGTADTEVKDNGKKVTIRVATQSLDPENSVMRDVLEQFEADNPNVKIELEESPGNDLITKINTDIMGDNTPDLFTFWRPEAKWNVDKYIEKGAIADLTDLVKSDAFFTDLFPDYAWKTATINDKIYCIPRMTFYMEFLVNKTIFDQYSIPLPTDWDSLVNACAQLKANGIIPWAVDTKEGLDDSSRIFNAIINRTVGNAKGLELLKGNESFQQEDVMKALEYFYQVAPGNAPEDGAALAFDQVITKYLNTGKAGMILGNCLQVDVNLDDNIMKNLVALDFPLTPESVLDAPSLEQDVTNLVYIGAKAYADDSKKDYVIELMKRLVNNDTAKLMVEQERSVVPNIGLEIDASKVSELQRSAASIAQNSAGDKWLLSYAKPGPVDEFRIVINEFWAGNTTPAEFAEKLDAALLGK